MLNGITDPLPPSSIDKKVLEVNDPTILERPRSSCTTGVCLERALSTSIYRTQLKWPRAKRRATRACLLAKEDDEEEEEKEEEDERETLDGAEARRAKKTSIESVFPLWIPSVGQATNEQTSTKTDD